MAVTFGTPVVVNMSSQASFNLVMSSVTSGQPIFVMRYSWETGGITSITDTFSGSYSWTSVETKTTGTTRGDLWIGTGGSGTSGTITVNGGTNACGGIAIACSGASTASGLSAVDSHTNSSGSSTSPSVSVTPTSATQGILAYMVGFISTADPTSPWTSTDMKTGSTIQAGVATYPSPPASQQTATWTGTSQSWGTFAAVVKAAAVASSGTGGIADPSKTASAVTLLGL